MSQPSVVALRDVEYWIQYHKLFWASQIINALMLKKRKT